MDSSRRGQALDGWRDQALPDANQHQGKHEIRDMRDAVGPQNGVASGRPGGKLHAGTTAQAVSMGSASQILTVDEDVRDANSRKALWCAWAGWSELEAFASRDGNTHRGDVSRSVCAATMRVVWWGRPDG